MKTLKEKLLDEGHTLPYLENGQLLEKKPASRSAPKKVA